jgi:hypothetical protein
VNLIYFQLIASVSQSLPQRAAKAGKQRAALDPTRKALSRQALGDRRSEMTTSGMSLDGAE